MNELRMIIGLSGMVFCGVGLKLEKLPLKLRLALIAVGWVLLFICASFIFDKSDWEY